MWCITKHDSMPHNVLVTWHYVFTYSRRWASILNIMSVMSDIRCFIPISEKFLCLTKVFLVRYWRNPISRIFIMLVWMLLFESCNMLKRENGYGDEHDNWRGHEHGHGHGGIKKFGCWISVKSFYLATARYFYDTFAYGICFYVIYFYGIYIYVIYFYTALKFLNIILLL